MLKPIAVLLLCQLVGESAARALGLAVPGPVLGFLLLFLILVLRDSGWAPRWPSLGGAPDEPLGRAADGLLSVLGLLFVPAGVGVIDNLGLLAAHGLGLVATLALSALATLLSTVGIFLLVAGRRSGDDA
ncbi:CidA/LrgA family protein [Aureimonas sp. AU4]|uniref:CidA/LrgA family protein n=1 Tax=Aureimonas sp. AU4 TaxID=1638163 RepID=UPI0007810898|nr:CidA/LrgA family protein [Aureimonas sp. AU4]